MRRLSRAHVAVIDRDVQVNCRRSRWPVCQRAALQRRQTGFLSLGADAHDQQLVSGLFKKRSNSCRCAAAQAVGKQHHRGRAPDSRSTSSTSGQAVLREFAGAGHDGGVDSRQVLLEICWSAVRRQHRVGAAGVDDGRFWSGRRASRSEIFCLPAAGGWAGYRSVAWMRMTSNRISSAASSWLRARVAGASSVSHQHHQQQHRKPGARGWG